MTIAEARKFGQDSLKASGVEGPVSSADFLLRNILHLSQTELLAHDNKKLDKKELGTYRQWIERRQKHEPVWYITGRIEFYGLDLLVTEDVLIPRPETEILLEKITSIEQKNDAKILDVGTGSGAIILSLASKITGEFFASDISKKALSVAKKNAKRLGFEVLFKEGDLFAPWIGQKFDIVVANLPYVPHEDMLTLAFDLIHYEPRTALDGGEKGIEIYDRFFTELPEVIATNATIYCEIGDKQGASLQKIVKKYLPKSKVEVVKDYAGFDRYLIVKT